MQLDSALELREHLLKENYVHIAQTDSRFDPKLRAQAIPVNMISNRQLGIGFSRRTEHDYHLELRLKHNSGQAFAIAERLKDKYKHEIHIGVIQYLRTLPPPNNDALSPFSTHKRPLHIGQSIGRLNGGTGTLGAFAETLRGERVVISNCHVLGEQRNLDIYQPGREDAMPTGLQGCHLVGKLANWTTFANIGSNYLDGAYAILESEIHISRNIIPDTNIIPETLPGAGTQLRAPKVMPEQEEQEARTKEAKLRSIEFYRQQYVRDLDLRYDQEVAKIGRTTGYTTGYLNAVSVDDVIIDMGQSGDVRFDNLLEIRWKDLNNPFAKEGDSGSVVFLKDKCLAVGLHLAGGVLEIDNEKFGISYACNLAHLLGTFNLTFL